MNSCFLFFLVSRAFLFIVSLDTKPGRCQKIKRVYTTTIFDNSLDKMEPKLDDLENGRFMNSTQKREIDRNGDATTASSPTPRDEGSHAVEPASTPPDGGRQAWMAGRQIKHKDTPSTH